MLSYHTTCYHHNRLISSIIISFLSVTIGWSFIFFVHPTSTIYQYHEIPIVTITHYPLPYMYICMLHLYLPYIHMPCTCDSYGTSCLMTMLHHGTITPSFTYRRIIIIIYRYSIINVVRILSIVTYHRYMMV